MATFGIDGLASGLDTTSLINQLMQVEAMPQTLLKQKQSNTQTLVQALQGLNTRVASLAEAAKKAAAPESWEAYTATTTGAGATATASSSAQPGSVSFHVDQLATSRVTVTAAVPDDGTLVPGYPPTLAVRKADGSFVEVHPTSGSLADIARALNEAADAGIKATVIRVSNGDGVNPPLYRLQLTGVTTGTDGGFELHAGPADAVDGTTRLDSIVVRPEQNAVVTLWKGVPGLEQTYEQSSNTFSDLMAGVDITVSAVTEPDAEPVTVTVGQDDAAIRSLASGLVGAMGVVLAEIASRTATTTKTNTDGTTTVTGGLFSGDASVRQLREQLMSAMSLPVDGTSPSEVGIVITRDGTFTFDEKKFNAALAADPAKVQAMVSAIATRVDEVATAASDKYEGSLTLKIQGQESLVRDMGTQIEAWDRRLELRRANLQKVYSALEVTLSNLQSQSTWLAGQLAGLGKSAS